jgi:hypothetical protein
MNYLLLFEYTSWGLNYTPPPGPALAPPKVYKITRSTSGVVLWLLRTAVVLLGADDSAQYSGAQRPYLQVGDVRIAAL